VQINTNSYKADKDLIVKLYGDGKSIAEISIMTYIPVIVVLGIIYERQPSEELKTQFKNVVNFYGYTEFIGFAEELIA
jgi:hypothetical protein